MAIDNGGPHTWSFFC